MKDRLIKYNEFILLNYPQIPEEFKKITMFSTMSQEQEQNPVFVEKLKTVFFHHEDIDKYESSIMSREMPLLIWGKKQLIDESNIFKIISKDPKPQRIYNDYRKITSSKKDLLKLYQDCNYDFIPKTYFSKSEAKANLKFPIIAKSLNSFQSRGVEKIENEKKLDSLSDDYDLFQEQLPISDEYRFIFFKGFNTEMYLIAAFHRKPANKKAKNLRESMSFKQLKDNDYSEFIWTQKELHNYVNIKLFKIAEAVFKHNPGLNVVGLDIAFINNDMKNPYYIEQNLTPGMIANMPFLIYKFIYEDNYHRLSNYSIKRLEQLSIGYMIKRFREDELFKAESEKAGSDFSGISYSNVIDMNNLI